MPDLWKITVDSIIDELLIADDLINLHIAEDQRLTYQPSWAELSCNDAINALIFELP